MRNLLFAVAAIAGAGVAMGDDNGKLEALIRRAHTEKAEKLSIPKAVYRLDRPLVFEKLRNLSVDCGGSLFVFTNSRAGIRVSGCDQLTLSNFTLDYAPLPFTQGLILEIDAPKQRMRIKLHKGYPAFPRMERINTHIFDPKTRSWKNGTPDYFGRNITATEFADEFYVDMPDGFASFVEAGDLVAFDWRSGTAIDIKSTRDFKLYDAVVYTSPSIAIMGRFTTGKHHFERVKVERGPVPEGAEEPRLLSSAADALNYAYCENGPDIISCDFSFQGDDSINFHSVALPIVKVESPTSILVLRPYPREGFPEVIRKGMELRLMDARDFRVLEKGNIVKCELEPGFDVPVAEVSKLFHNFRPEKDPRRTVYRITLEKDMKFEPGMFIDVPAICGANFVIRDNYFHDHRARAIRMMASNGIIENNRIERIKQNAITIGGEYAFWREAGWAENIIVRNNRIKDVGLDERITSVASYAPGAIALIMRSEEGAEHIVSGNRNIVIEDNVIDGCSAAGIVIHAVDGATVRNNVIRNVNQGNISNAGRNYGFKISKPIEVTPSAVNVKLENNRVE